jgi:hypothetical protein
VINQNKEATPTTTSTHLTAGKITTKTTHSEARHKEEATSQVDSGNKTTKIKVETNKMHLKAFATSDF